MNMFFHLTCFCLPGWTVLLLEWCSLLRNKTLKGNWFCFVWNKIHLSLKKSKPAYVAKKQPFSMLLYVHNNPEDKDDVMFCQWANFCLHWKCLQGGESQGSLSEMTCSESASSFQSVSQSSTPELLIGLVYNATTGRLSVEIIKGIHFKNLAANKPPSKYPKWFLFPFYETDEPHQKLSLCIGLNLLSYVFHF